MGKDEKLCNYCKKLIDLNRQKYILLGTYDKKRPLAEPYFHFNCFYTWYNGKVQEKAQNQIKSATQRAMSMVKNVMGNQVQQVQELDLTKETQIDIPDYSREVKEISSGISSLFKKKEKKKNGREKRRKTKMSEL